MWLVSSAETRPLHQQGAIVKFNEDHNSAKTFPPRDAVTRLGANSVLIHPREPVGREVSQRKCISQKVRRPLNGSRLRGPKLEMNWSGCSIYIKFVLEVRGLRTPPS